MAFIGFVLSAVIADKIGRRWTFIFFAVPFLINWIILYNAKEFYQFMLSRVIGGVSVGVMYVLTIFVTSEYTSPKTRAFFLNMITTATPAIATGFIHSIGVVLHWRTVTFIGMFMAVIGLILPYFWVESPHWLASKGKFEECETAFRALHGSSLDSERELRLLIKMEKTKMETARETNCRPTGKRLLRALKTKYFWGLLLLSIFMQLYFTATGKLIFSILMTVIMEDITGTSDVLLFTLLVDGFIIIGSCMSCILIRRTSIRTLLFSTGLIANAILIIFSACFYFKSGQSYLDWINAFLLALYFTIINAGPYPVLEALFSEIFPLELKMYIFFMSSILLIVSLTAMTILLPHIVSFMGYHGLFIMNATIMSVCLGFIWLKLPETKGRTLQEIEVYFKTKRFDIDEVLNNDQMKTLI